MFNIWTRIIYSTFICFITIFTSYPVSCGLLPVDDIRADAIAMEKTIWLEIKKYQTLTDRARRVLLIKIRKFHYDLIFRDNSLLLNDWTSKQFFMFKNIDGFQAKIVDLEKISDKFIEFRNFLDKINELSIKDAMGELQLVANQTIRFGKYLAELYNSRNFIYDFMQIVSKPYLLIIFKKIF